MKQMKASFLCVLLGILLCFSSCGDQELTPKEIYGGDFTPTDHQTVYTIVTALPEDYGNILATGTHLVQWLRVTDAASECTVYDLFTKRVVGQYTSLDSEVLCRFYTFYGKDYYTVSYTDAQGKKTVLCAPDGTELECVREQCEARARGDLLGLQNTVFRIGKDGTVEKRFENNDFLSDVNVSHAMQGSYYYRIQGGDVRTVTVYNEALQPLSSYTFRNDGAIRRDYFILENGKILVQYLYQAKAQEEGAFFCATSNVTGCVVGDARGEYVRMVSLCIDPESGSVTEVDLNFYVRTLRRKPHKSPQVADAYQTLWQKYENIATVSIIKNGTSGSYEGEAVALSNGLEIKAYLSRTIMEQSGLPQRISEDRYLIEAPEGNHFLVDGDGTVLQPATASGNITSVYYLKEKGVYRIEDGACLLDYGQAGYTLQARTEYGVFLSRGTEYFFFDGSDVIALSDIKPTDGSLGYEVKTLLLLPMNNGRYALYNGKGERIWISPPIGTVTLVGYGVKTYYDPATGKSAKLVQQKQGEQSHYYLVTAD